VTSYVPYNWNLITSSERNAFHHNFVQNASAAHPASYPVDTGNGKAIPMQAWSGPEGYRRMELPDFMTIGT